MCLSEHWGSAAFGSQAPDSLGDRFSGLHRPQRRRAVDRSHTVLFDSESHGNRCGLPMPAQREPITILGPGHYTTAHIAVRLTMADHQQPDPCGRLRSATLASGPCGRGIEL